jgi:type I restriction enzyme M protein
MSPADIVQKLWNYCNVLRDDEMSYGDYVEQLTYLLFLKMTDERSSLPTFLSGRERTQTGSAGKAVSIVPEKYS